MKRTLAAMAAAMVLAAVAPPAAAGDAAAGREKAKICTACHALNGQSLRPDVPHLSAQSEFYVAEQLRLYRSGERKNDTMKIMSAPLSDEDIDNLAAWYASVKISVEDVE